MGRATAIALASLCLLAGCDGDSGYGEAMGEKHKVTLYSGGKPVRTWVARNPPIEAGAGFYFRDDATGTYVEVGGTVVIERCRPASVEP
jgi:hypothetical protein